ncbi:MAG: DUF3459 domain-containing protein, partial [Anaerolineaceae bacterium]|nr:DUF3459 domain-containing protein [Anaerolineaceae bacterium]
MKRIIFLGLILILISALLPACGPSQEQINQLSTQIANEIYSSLTPNVTALPTETPTPQPMAVEISVDPILGLPEGTDGYPWWNDTLFYEIFVRSFYDSDGDGIGDINGIIQKLDYLNDGDPDTDSDLGITGIWLMPIFPSPSYHGYDVTNYYDINPEYGTMDDFKTLLEEAHSRGIRVIIDLVVNHTSNQHPWFTQAKDPSSPYHDWYIWSDTNPGYMGSWGQQVWFPIYGQYYYSTFTSGMPDLNYNNPEVTDQMEDVVQFWLEDVGVDGFRMDAAKHLIEEGMIQANSASTHNWWKDFRPFYKQINPEALVVGEVWDDTSITSAYLQGDELDLSFEFWLAGAVIEAVNAGDNQALEDQMEYSYSEIPNMQYATFLTNHDQDRVLNQVNSDENRMAAASALLLTSPGVPFIYYGEEIGMTGSQIHERIRRPMQWTGDAAFGGFTTGSPWQALGEGWMVTNVADERLDSDSIWSTYRDLIQIRNQHAALRVGDLVMLTTTDEAIISYLRVSEDEAVLVLVNLSNHPVDEVWLAKSDSGLSAGEYQLAPLLGSESFNPMHVSESGGIFHLIDTPQIPA